VKHRCTYDGGMAAYMPNKNDATTDQIAMELVHADKDRAGTAMTLHRVALPREIFDRHMPQGNQIDRKLSDVNVTAADLLEIAKADITETGLRQNIEVSIGYFQS
jgi:malate synthase